jgi:hypothetical protein
MSIVQLAATLMNACDQVDLLERDMAVWDSAEVPVTKEDQDVRTVHPG